MIVYQELESCALSVAQTHKDTAFVHIMKRTQENDILHVIRKRMEKYKYLPVTLHKNNKVLKVLLGVHLYS